MRAVVLERGELSVVEMPVPRPARGQILVRVLRSGICGSDLHARRFADQSADVAAEVGYADFMRHDHRVVLGHEFVGEVVSYGPGSRGRWPAGSRVVTLPLIRHAGEVHMTGLSPRAPGGYAEYVLVDEDATIPVPPGVPDDLAALTEPLAVAHHAVRRAQVRRRDTALVVGCGPIGLAVILMLKSVGVRRVIASDLAPGRRELARRCGADVVVDPASESPWSHLADGHVTSATDLYGGGIQAMHSLRTVPGIPWARVLAAARRAGLGPSGPAVFECVGVPGVIEDIVTHAPFLSRVVVVGVCMTPDTFRPTMASNKEIELRFSFSYDPAEFHDTLQLIARRRIDPRPLVTDVVALDDVAAAFDRLAHAGTHAKVLIAPGRVARDSSGGRDHARAAGTDGRAP
ncbi:zinc-binding dehydrogenase [Georgenia sp. TF02-10]|uniref:zinc-binding dehydrogenase n=1 Tax=Georgenia sp. TF02-10 TaxID=2917725 RepID=UPI001FA7F741|nr:zinc-binding dehydrogenase [Georgenia sp. TF02-10]UNX56496.1 zinc-binding dehydrogenase [Georgenia sp. TF02-10]